MNMPVMTQEELLQRRRNAARTAFQLAGFCVILLVMFVGSVMLKNRAAKPGTQGAKTAVTAKGSGPVSVNGSEDSRR